MSGGGGGGGPDAWSRAHSACRRSVPLDCRVPTHRRRFSLETQ